MRPLKLVILVLIVLMLIATAFALTIYKKAQIQERAQALQQAALIQKKSDNQKKLQDCLAKQDVSLQKSIETECANSDNNPTCSPSQTAMQDIMRRVDENKDICRLKYENNY